MRISRFVAPTALTLVEQGGKFAVILQRLLQRYEAMNWASVVVGEPEQLAAEHQAWALASATGTELSQTPFESGYDVIVIDGTSMAGLLVANGWLKGMAKEVDLLVAKALGSDGSGSDTLVADAVDWCVENGADVISLSLGGAPNILPFSIGSGRTSGDAANDAIDAGVYVVAAAGNDGEDDDGDVAHPSSEAGVISVGGVTIKGTHWSGSSKGDNNGRLLPLPILMPRGDPNKKPEVVAPAEGVPVLTEDGGWGIADGTSAATVYVTGALCLLLEQKPELKPEASNGADTVDTVKRWLMDSAVPEEGQTTHDDYYGYGLLNVSGLIDLATQA